MSELATDRKPEEISERIQLKERTSENTVGTNQDPKNSNKISKAKSHEEEEEEKQAVTDKNSET